MSEVRSSDQWSQAQPLDQRKKILFLSLFFLLLEEEGRIEDSQWGHLSQKPLTVFCLFVFKKKKPCVGAFACNPGAGEAEKGGLLGLAYKPT